MKESYSKGEQMLDARWKAFATKHGLVLLAPSFRAEGKENNEGKGYYYPELGSGEVMEKALQEVEKRTGVETNKIKESSSSPRPSGRNRGSRGHLF
jgi:hypothetical protein